MEEMYINEHKVREYGNRLHGVRIMERYRFLLIHAMKPTQPKSVAVWLCWCWHLALSVQIVIGGDTHSTDKQAQYTPWEKHTSCPQQSPQPAPALRTVDETRMIYVFVTMYKLA